MIYTVAYIAPASGNRRTAQADSRERAETLAAIIKEAGFSGVEILTMPTDNYTAVPVIFSEEDGEWLIAYATDSYSGPVRDHIRCDCHDLIWHHGELHYLDTTEGMLAVCDLPFHAWPDHTVIPRTPRYTVR